ncbi:MAG: radical SAM protein [Synergistaceae bacterium]|nr:radical SAM protein [Synergistaceae bacterium]
MAFNMKEYVEGLGAKIALSYLDSDPETNIPKIVRWVEKFDRNGIYSAAYPYIDKIANDPDDIWFKFIKSIYSDIDPKVRKTIFRNFLLNSAIAGFNRRTESEKKYNCNVPWAMLIDPTSACNLNCVGCWAAEYDHALNMDFTTLDSIVTQGKELGTYMYLFSGGEPLMRKTDIIRLCEKHDDCTFLAFTNATLIDDDFADEMLRVKNFIPAISVEGFEEETDFRRGKGTYRAVEKAMDILKNRKLPFGISCCYTSKNIDSIGSEAFFDHMIEKGAKFAWLFTYMPIGVNAETDLMVTPEQREFMYHRIREFRKTKPIFTMDFWNDGEYVGGCIAGGRRYLHINANGDIEPCAFIHYSDSNIHEKTLLEAYQSPLFMQYRANQPFNDNMLRPCPLLDNHGRLTEIVEKSGAVSTDMLNRENVRDLSSKCEKSATAWAPVASKLWSDRTIKHIEQ